MVHVTTLDRFGSTQVSSATSYHHGEVSLVKVGKSFRGVSLREVKSSWAIWNTQLGGGFKYLFIFTPIPEEIIQFDDNFFSDGLKPPTSQLEMLQRRLVISNRLWYGCLGIQGIMHQTLEQWKKTDCFGYIGDPGMWGSFHKPIF